MENIQNPHGRLCRLRESKCVTLVLARFHREVFASQPPDLLHLTRPTPTPTQTFGIVQRLLQCEQAVPDNQWVEKPRLKA
jgi:hypothetical protein